MRGRPDFGNDLLRRVDAQSGHTGQSLRSLLLRPQQACELLIERFDLLFDQTEFLKRQLQQPPRHRIEVGAGAERLTSLGGGRAQAAIRERDHRVRIPFAVRQRL